MENLFVATLTVEQLLELFETVVEKKLKEHLPPPPPKLYKHKEACKIFGISSPTLTKYTRQGRIKATYLGTKPHYEEAQIREALRTVKKYQQIKCFG